MVLYSSQCHLLTIQLWHSIWTDMASLLAHLVFLLAGTIAATSAFTYELQLSEYYHVRWEPDYAAETCTFTLTVTGTSYVGFGISQRGTMVGSDIVIGGVLVDGRPYFGDYHGTDQGTPPLDQSQDYQLLSSSENATHTVLRFSRKFDTGDANDEVLNARNTNFIFAIGGYDPVIPDDILVFHGPLRGWHAVQILDPEELPPPDPCEPVNPVEKEMVLDAEGAYHVSWFADLDTQFVEFFLTVRTTGYVGFGLSSSGNGMVNADLIMGGAYVNGSGYFADYWSTGPGMPVRDTIQNYSPTANMVDNGTHTMLQFRRAFDTGDSFDYNPISDRVMHIIWSYGETDDIAYHGNVHRGQVQTTILIPLPDECETKSGNKQ